MTYAEYLRECTEWKISAIWSAMASGELNFLPARLLACICYYPFVCCGGPAGQVWGATSLLRAGPRGPALLAKEVPSPSMWPGRKGTLAT